MSDQPRSSPPRRVASDDRLVVGRLESHGPANYQFREGSSPSYYLKVVTNRGLEVLWGKDLARALAESRTRPKIGSVIGVRRTGYETFTVSERRRDAAGQMTDTQRQVRRNQWIVESAEFFADRARLARRVRDAREDARSAVKSHPELAATYLSLRGAQEIAERRIADPKDRERFLALVREAMAKSIKDGDPLPGIRLRDRSTQPTHEITARLPGSKRDAPTR
jgi:hypothetical protein